MLRVVLSRTKERARSTKPTKATTCFRFIENVNIPDTVKVFSLTRSFLGLTSKKLADEEIRRRGKLGLEPGVNRKCLGSRIANDGYVKDHVV